MMLRKLDRVGASMYVSQVRQLVDSLLYRIDVLEKARTEWLVHHAIATEQAASERDEFSHTTFNEALNATTTQQTLIFDELNALLADWAQLSLLFHPIPEKGDIGEWRVSRGAILRSLLCLPDDSLLGNRAFRDSWMHFDERLDQAYLGGWLGNRQQFVQSVGVPAATQQSVRVIDVESLSFHYRARNGALESVSVDDMKKLLLSLVENLKTVGPRIVEQLPYIRPPPA